MNTKTGAIINMDSKHNDETQKPPVVLVVDDNEQNLELLQVYTQQHLEFLTMLILEILILRELKAQF